MLITPSWSSENFDYVRVRVEKSKGFPRRKKAKLTFEIVRTGHHLFLNHYLLSSSGLPGALSLLSITSHVLKLFKMVP